MAPAVEYFAAADLPQRVQLGLDGRARKTAGGRVIDLARDCELFRLLQYECRVDSPVRPNSRLRCFPVRRWFRR